MCSEYAVCRLGWTKSCTSLVAIYIGILIFNNASKVYKFTGHEYNHSILNTFSPNFIFLNFRH